MKPYIGITGFKTQEEVLRLSDVFEHAGLGSGRYTAMFGFGVSSKRLAKMEKCGSGTPAAEDLPGLAGSVPSWAIPMMHYFTKVPDVMNRELRDLFSLEGMYEKGICRAVQLNMSWPKVGDIERLVKDFPDMEIVLQLPERAMSRLSTEEISRKAAKYDSLVSYVLVDPSGGTGTEFDVEQGIELMNSLYEKMPQTIIGIAGGFSAENVGERVRRIKDSFPKDFCIDAQGKLAENRAIVYSKAKAYIENAARGLL